MNEERPEPAPAPTPGPDLRPKKTRHGRAPKDCRGDRNKRQRGKAIRSLVNWSMG